MRAALLIIGDEILSGDTLDTNSQFAAALLNSSGFELIHTLSAGDRPEDIRRALDYLFAQADLVISTGGLGPTQDDVTKQVLAEYFHTRLVFSQDVYTHLENWLAGRGVGVNVLNRQQAMVPASARVMNNPVGTAPVFWFEKEGKTLICLPGVPQEMRHILKNIILPQLVVQFDSMPAVQLTINTSGIPESDLAMRIAEVEDQIRRKSSVDTYYKLAYLPGLGGVRLQLTGRGKQQDDIRTALEGFQQDIVSHIGEYVFGYGDTSLQEAVGQMLRDANATVATAESCTGGYLAHLLTSIAGSSAYYIGSVISYANEVKMQELGVREETLRQHGAVSEETLREMLSGALAKFGTTYAMATTGIAGPGGAVDGKPAGTVWIGVAGKEGMVCRQYRFNRSRIDNIHLFAVTALDMLRRYMVSMQEEA